ncbi:maintenance of mitochondrial morphology protein 1 [Lentinula guzmanii]|uniref:Maintenance of mitochondrial morphology protein 1 n=1 Tax=Lentinula guzmanii TaxID=2804957 RepID=A0AA38N5C3_9AGAR|nr:maintenance of mitochondrial morphology protein 1 [Lentinula guzmanii]KAJ3798828.1 maintenance of mitochondrial morphology protein 1 [Lentinula aff. detonsa]
MGTNYVFSLQPTFTQGLILGQLSILALLVFVLKYLFMDSTKYPFETTTYHPRINSDSIMRSQKLYQATNENGHKNEDESAEWLNLLLHQIVGTYRSKLQDDLPGAEGDEVARKRVEDYANKIRPASFLDHIVVHSVDLGSSAPRLSNGRRVPPSQSSNSPEIEFDVNYVDTVSVSLSTSYLFNYPMALFARLPVALTISLSLFRSSVTITPPLHTSPAPTLTFSISPTFTLDLTTMSLMGSRAKLANVPKLHDLIQHQVHRVLAAKGVWKVVLPGLATVEEAKQEVKNEMADAALS